MAREIPVADPGDERLRDYVRLRDVSLRRSLEAERGLFIAEGEKVVRRAVEAGYAPRSFLMTSRWLDSLRDVLGSTGDDVACYVADDAVVEALTGFHVHRGALAALERRPLPRAGDLLADARRVVVLEDLVDHANVGAVLRSATALGADAALLGPRCADPLYRRSLKVAMGAVLTLPWTRLPERPTGPELLHAAGFTVVALTPAADAVDLRDLERTLDRAGRVALLLGGEGHGLSTAWCAGADVRARIPLAAGPAAAAVDSLNVAAAAAVACYALLGG